MNPKLWLLRRAASVGGQVLVEKARRPVADSLREVPVQATAVTDEWLTQALCRDVPGARVVSFHSPSGHSGTSTRAALRVEYNDAGKEAGLQTKLFVKTTTAFSQRLLLGGARLLDGETQFFMTMRPLIEMEAPLGYWGGVDQTSWRSMVLMEDIAETRGATFIEPTTSVTREQVEDLVRNLARYHGALWEDPAIRILKTPADHIHNTGTFINMRARSAVGLERAKAVVPPALHGQADTLWQGTLESLQMATDELPRTLLHGDCHIGQTYITGDGRMGLTDWQTCQQGGWGYDYAYLVGSACEPEDRRAWERDLLEIYLEGLARAGAPAPTFDDAWLTYRQQLFYPYTAWSFAFGRAWYQPRFQPDDTCLTIIRRLSHAIDELDSPGALGLG